MGAGQAGQRPGVGGRRHDAPPGTSATGSCSARSAGAALSLHRAAARGTGRGWPRSTAPPRPSSPRPRGGGRPSRRRSTIRLVGREPGAHRQRRQVVPTAGDGTQPDGPAGDGTGRTHLTSGAGRLPPARRAAGTAGGRGAAWYAPAAVPRPRSWRCSACGGWRATPPWATTRWPPAGPRCSACATARPSAGQRRRRARAVLPADARLGGGGHQPGGAAHPVGDRDGRRRGADRDHRPGGSPDRAGPGCSPA